MRVEEFFDQFLVDNLNLNKLCDGECDGTKPGCDICFITSKYKELVEDIKSELKILPTKDEENLPSYFLTGSYRRHTMIRPPKDVDLFIVLDSGEYQDSELNDLIMPTALVNKLKTTLEKIFSGNKSIKIKVQRHSVTVKYSKKFSIDVIPAFETDDKKAYKIPDIEHGENGIYIVSNPKLHYDYINKVNDATSVDSKKRFKKVVRLLKFIKRNEFGKKPMKIRSFHFELLAAKILESDKISSYASGLKKFLYESPSYFDKAVIIDPANSSNKVDDYIDNLSPDIKNTIKNRLKELYEISKTAVDFESLGYYDKALSEWKKIFSTKKDIEKGGASSGYSYVGNSTSKPWSNF